MKKIIKSILLIITLIMSMLSGCSSSETPNENNEKNEITIASFLENGFLEYAARKYEESHSGTKIVLDIYTFSNEHNIERYSQIINTELMSGGGADIIDVAYINWVTLANRNRLYNLKEEFIFSGAEFYTNILDAYFYNGGRYVIPLCFDFKALKFSDSFKEESIGQNLTLDKLVDLAGQYPDNPLFRSNTGLYPSYLAYEMFDIKFKDYIDVLNKKVNINSDEFIAMLEKINSMKNLREPKQGETSLMWELLLYNPVMDANGVTDYTDMFLLTNENSEGLAEILGFLPSINANSKNHELAVDFIKFLLSDEMQSSPELTANPININASAEIAKARYTAYQMSGVNLDGIDLNNNIMLFNKMAEQLTLVNYSDSIISQFVREAFTGYFNGETTAAQTAANLQTRLTTYLNE